MSAIQEKEIRQIFVIMPFKKTPTRDAGHLTSFFEGSIKAPIENENLKFRYQVRRSDETFDINAQIIKDLYYADIVICDLSGTDGNPNVMYELGIRLALSNGPVILIREKHKDNKQIFDINGFYTYPYDPLNYADLTKYIIREIKDLEEKKKKYKSPVLAIIQQELPLLEFASVQRADQLLATMRSSVKMVTRLFIKRFIKCLSQDQSVDFPDEAFSLSGLLQYIENHRDKFADVKLSDFRVNFGAQPTLDYYLANQYLNGLIEPKLERVFTGFVITYHSYFVSTNYYQGEWNLMNVRRFLGETNIFLQCTKLFRILLAIENEKEKDKIRDIFVEILKTSHIYSFDEYDKAQSSISQLDTNPT